MFLFLSFWYTGLKSYPGNFGWGGSWPKKGQKGYKDNGLKISKLRTPRNIIEASGGKLDIVGQCEFYMKLQVLGKTKRLNCLVLRGNNVDREILISGKMLKLRSVDKHV